MTTRVLLVESDPDRARSLAGLAAEWGEEVISATTAGAALEALESDPHLVILDGGLPGGATRTVARAAALRRPTPIVVVLGVDDTPEQSFRLHEIGVRGYVAKQAPLAAVRREVERALTSPPNLAAFAVAAVGRSSLHSVIHEVRRAMLDQALALSNGSRSGAARLLAVSRQAVQQIVRERERTRARAPGGAARAQASRSSSSATV